MNKQICEMVAERVLAELENGVIPWNKPWFGTGKFVKHHNGESYSLLNCILLEEPGEYASFAQIKKEGGSVKKGAKSKIVVFWKMVRKEETDDDTGEKKVKTFPYLQYSRVFNLNDCENIKKKYVKDDEVAFVHDTVAEAEEIISKYKTENPSLIIMRERRSNDAFYRVSDDYIQVPAMEQYERGEEFYSTLFHEMAHSTGHWNRLGRFKESGKVAAFGEADYGKEELIAELGAAALCGKRGIETRDSFRNSAAYLDGWTKAIKGNPELIVSAAGKADKAVSYILEGKK